MKRTFFALLFWIVSSAALAAYIGDLTAADTGLTNAALASTPVSSAIEMDTRTLQAPFRQHFNHLSLEVSVTKGSSATLRIRCKASQTNNAATAAWASICYQAMIPGDPDACQVDVREYTLTADTVIKSEWRFNSSFVWCEFDDPADGSGTITVTGRRGRV